MAALDREIDRLYQLPLAEFTKARDELAKREPSHRSKIRRLQKPNLPAWAVNQLHWRERGAYEALVAAAERLRRAQVVSLGGKAADVPKAEAAHISARKAALERIRRILDAAGEKTSPATMTAISETLNALPAEGAAGRLVRALKPAGFEALAGLLGGRKIAPRRAEVVPFRPSANERAAEDRAAEREARRREQKREQERARLALRLREAEKNERAANAALALARRALARAERDHAKATRQLETAAERVERSRRAMQEAERRASQASIARATLESEKES